MLSSLADKYFNKIKYGFRKGDSLLMLVYKVI